MRCLSQCDSSVVLSNLYHRNLSPAFFTRSPAFFMSSSATCSTSFAAFFCAASFATAFFSSSSPTTREFIVLGFGHDDTHFFPHLYQRSIQRLLTGHIFSKLEFAFFPFALQLILFFFRMIIKPQIGPVIYIIIKILAVVGMS